MGSVACNAIEFCLIFCRRNQYGMSRSRVSKYPVF
jgi:hypothetical protein